MRILPATGFLFYIHIIIMQEKDSRSSIATPIAALLRQKALLQTEYEEEKENYGRQRGCVKTPKKNSQSPDFPKPGLCYVQKFLYL